MHDVTIAFVAQKLRVLENALRDAEKSVADATMFLDDCRNIQAKHLEEYRAMRADYEQMTAGRPMTMAPIEPMQREEKGWVDLPNTHSRDGREWARLSDLSEGDPVRFDGDFTCGLGGQMRVVKASPSGFYVDCYDGKHFLTPNATDGPGADGDHLIGIWPVK